jgi:hypothetical protein
MMVPTGFVLERLRHLGTAGQARGARGGGPASRGAAAVGPWPSTRGWGVVVR